MTKSAFEFAADLLYPEEDEFATPGAMAQALDVNTVQTPALAILDEHLVQVRIAMEAMVRRHARFAELLSEGAEHDEAVRQSEVDVPKAGINRLIISMPPQEGKTERVSRRGTLWLLRQFPGLRAGIVSYDIDNAARISQLIRSDVEIFNGEEDQVDLGLRLVYGQKAVSRWHLAPPHGGSVFATGIRGRLTGRPLELLVIDDPVKDVLAAESLLLSAQNWEWWSTVARPRLAPGAPAIVVATRWHEADLSGRLIMQQTEDEAQGIEHHDEWVVVNIPAEADTDDDALGRKRGEFMQSARGRSRTQWEATKAATPPRHWLALYQGRPAPEEGEIWLKSWWRRYNEAQLSAQPDGSYAGEFDMWLQSWDCAFKKTEESDYVVGQVWGKRGADSYLLYEVWKRMTFTETLEAIKRVSRLFPLAHRKVIEEAANGAAVIDSLKKQLPGITPALPYKSKVERANAVSPFIQAGNVHLPTGSVAIANPDVAWDPESFLAETAAFPNGANDDQVDACSQALAALYLGLVGQATVSGSGPRIPGVAGPGGRHGPADWQVNLARRSRG